MESPLTEAPAGEDNLPSLCGGLDAGPIATGAGFGDTLQLTLTQDVPCDSVIMVFPLGFTAGAPLPEGGSLTSATDSKGGVYTVTTFTEAVVGAAADVPGGGVSDPRLVFGPSAILNRVGGVLQAGDTIDLQWTLSFPANFAQIAMAFAVTNVSRFATPQDIGATGVYNIEYGNIDSYPSYSGNDFALGWCFDLGECFNMAPAPQSFGAMLAVSGILDGTGPYVPYLGDKIGEFSSGRLSLAVSLTRCLDYDVIGIDPGGEWTTGGPLLVGNYQFTRIVC